MFDHRGERGGSGGPDGEELCSCPDTQYAFTVLFHSIFMKDGRLLVLPIQMSETRLRLHRCSTTNNFSALNVFICQEVKPGHLTCLYAHFFLENVLARHLTQVYFAQTKKKKS